MESCLRSETHLIPNPSEAEGFSSATSRIEIGQGCATGDKKNAAPKDGVLLFVPMGQATSRNPVAAGFTGGSDRGRPFALGFQSGGKGLSPRFDERRRKRLK
jgi:hypothetical protein